MHAEVAALLDFLLSESKPETGDHGAQARISTTKSTRLGVATRDAGRNPHTRASGSTGAADERDRARTRQRRGQGRKLS